MRSDLSRCQCGHRTGPARAGDTVGKNPDMKEEEEEGMDDFPPRSQGLVVGAVPQGLLSFHRFPSFVPSRPVQLPRQLQIRHERHHECDGQPLKVFRAC